MAGGSDSASADMKAVIVSQLGELAKQIFGKSWEFGPTGLTPPSPNVGIFSVNFSAKKGSNMP